MKILFLTAHLPFPPASGGRRREFELVSRLGRNFDIYLCSLSSNVEIEMENAKQLRNYCKSVSLFKITDASGDKSSLRYPVLMRRYFSAQAIDEISQMLAEGNFDVVHVEGYYLMPLIQGRLDVPTVLVEHNMEYKLDLQRMLLSTSIAERRFYWREYFYTLYWERYYWRKARKIIALTIDDEESIRRLEPNVNVSLIPNGIDHKIAIDGPDRSSSLNGNCHSTFSAAADDDLTIKDDIPSILYVGNFLYDPNIDAAIYFCNNIFPLVLKEVDNARLYIVGNSPPPEITDLQTGGKEDNNIIVTGYVDSLDPFYKAAKVVVCPLRVGGGIKVKILEALRAGKAIVCTSVGAQGLGIDNRALCICDEIFDFANHVIRFLVNPRDRYDQEQLALRFANTIPTWDKVKEGYVLSYNEVKSTTGSKVGSFH